MFIIRRQRDRAVWSRSNDPRRSGYYMLPEREGAPATFNLEHVARETRDRLAKKYKADTLNVEELLGDE